MHPKGPSAGLWCPPCTAGGQYTLLQPGSSGYKALGHQALVTHLSPQSADVCMTLRVRGWAGIDPKSGQRLSVSGALAVVPPPPPPPPHGNAEPNSSGMSVTNVCLTHCIVTGGWMEKANPFPALSFDFY